MRVIGALAAIVILCLERPARTSESPLDTAAFTDVCQKIGIFDPRSQPNDQHMIFVAAHIVWAMRIETQQFKREINRTKMPART